MKKITLQHRTERYHASPALNVSKMKSLDNPKWVKYREDNPDTEDQDKRHYRIGGAIDSILTSPELFNQEYVVSYRERPGGLMGIFIDALPLDLDPESDIELYREAYDESGYKTRMELIVKKLWEVEKYMEYYMSRKQAKGKQVLSYDEWEEVQHCKEYLLNNPFTCKYFRSTNPNLQHLFQVAIYVTLNESDISANYTCTLEDQEFKGLLDGVLIDHEKKLIQPYDLKTIGRSVKMFPFTYYNLGYYLQGALYYTLFKKWLEGEGTADFEGAEELRKKIKDYEVKPLVFIVTEKKTHHSNPAMIYRTTQEHVDFGLYGGTANGKKYKGVFELASNYQWHQANDYWDLNFDLYHNKGEVLLNAPETTSVYV